MSAFAGRGEGGACWDWVGDRGGWGWGWGVWSALEMGVVVCFVSDGGSRSFPRDREGPLCPSFSAERSTFVFYMSE